MASIFSGSCVWSVIGVGFCGGKDLAGGHAARLAVGRRTVTSWLRAAGVSDDFQDYYYFLAPLGRKAGSGATQLFLLVLRIAFAFDPDRNGILLIGGDKSGVSTKRFYKQLIEKADQLYAAHLAALKATKKGKK